MGLSGLVHAAVIGAAFLAARQTGLVPPIHLSETLTYIELTPPPPVIRTPPLRMPPPVVREVRLEPPLKVELPAPEPEKPREEPPTPKPEPEPPAPKAAPEPPKPAPPVVTVGAFAMNEATRRASELKAVEAAEFDSPVARAPEIRTASAVVGNFEQGPTRGRPQPGTDRPNAVSEAGFGAGVATGRGRATGGVVAAGGFGTGVAGGRGRGPAGTVAAGGFDSGKAADKGIQPPQTVKMSDFDARAEAAKAIEAPRQPVQTPIEILSKPTPTYTDEARALKIEGEVLLEVEFTATGAIRVLRVVRGLGHGLDEAARHAVQGVRFKPAQRNGEPIDVRTTVNIVFRLA
jgi:TonB family protein